MLRCSLIHISIIIVRHFLYFLYFCPCLDLGLFISYLCDLIFIFIMIDRIISWIQAHLFFCLLSRICPIIFGWSTWIIFQLAKVQPQDVAEHLLDFFANFSLALLLKLLLIKKRLLRCCWKVRPQIKQEQS